MRAAFLFLLLAACGLPTQDVLTLEKPPITVWDSCDAALAKAAKGDGCLGITTCVSKGTTCCHDKVECSSGTITTVEHDCSSCLACTVDENCGAGEWCLSSHCEPCLPPNAANGCPAPFVRLSRHGCQTDDCGPAANLSCSGSEKPLPGAYCQQNCAGDSCCVSACTPVECSSKPSPEGCFIECGTQSCAGTCRSDACTCVGGSWSCAAKCAGDAEPYSKRCKTAG